MKPESISDVTGGWLRLLVVPLLGCDDDGKVNGLLPVWRPAAANPRMGSGHRASKDGGKACGSKCKAVIPGHAGIIPLKKKNAMRKKELVSGYAMRKSMPMTATTYRHGIDYTLLISPITMPNATGDGYHSDYMLERIWNEDEEGRVSINTLHIGREHECRTMMELEMEEGLTIQ